ncbi:hypothetical protein H5410_027568 [Solanum commersonii]|uniref:Uncharacterized protein n=1 Tax=Solanum commersonii TaxID=4109 RepID=A0A9J5Z3Q9_SOLCO|nr:hypothetical protein H5410_027568 [Solanum commersonii]
MAQPQQPKDLGNLQRSIYVELKNIKQDIIQHFYTTKNYQRSRGSYILEKMARDRSSHHRTVSSIAEFQHEQTPIWVIHQTTLRNCEELK